MTEGKHRLRRGYLQSGQLYINRSGALRVGYSEVVAVPETPRRVAVGTIWDVEVDAIWDLEG